MPVPKPHRSPKADAGLAWDWSDKALRYTDELIDHGGWEAMVTAHAWHEASGAPPTRKSDFNLPHHRVLDGRVRVVLEGVRSAMNILAATRFQPQDYQVNIPASEVHQVYEHLAVHLEEFDEQPPAILDGWSPDDGRPPDPARRLMGHQAEDPIIIVGASRSTSTLVAELLGSACASSSREMNPVATRTATTSGSNCRRGSLVARRGPGSPRTASVSSCFRNSPPSGPLWSASAIPRPD